MKIAFWLLVSFTQSGFSQTVGIKNVNIIPYALESATNVSRLEANVRKTYNNVKGIFPKKGDVFELSDLGVISLMSYGGEFCTLMISRDMTKPPNQRWAHASIDFNIPAQSWSSADMTSVLERYSELFWQRPLQDDEIEFLGDSVPAILAELPSDYKSGPALMQGLCGVYVTAPAFLFVGGI